MYIYICIYIFIGMIILWIDWATKKLEMLAIFVGCSAHWPLKNKVWSMTESSFLSWSSGVLYPDGLKRIHWKSTAGPNQIHVLRRSRWFSFGKVSQTDVRGPVVKKNSGCQGVHGWDRRILRAWRAPIQAPIQTLESKDQGPQSKLRKMVLFCFKRN